MGSGSSKSKNTNSKASERPDTSSTTRTSTANQPPSTRQKHSRNPRLSECGFCMRSSASGYCVECGMLICKVCSDHHEDTNLLKRHNIISLREYSDNKAMMSKFVKPVMCSMHEGNEMTYYCNTCSIPICMVCAEYNHPRPAHSHVTLIAGVHKKHRELQDRLEKIKNKKKHLHNATSSHDAAEQDGNQQIKLTSSLIQEHTQQLVARLQKIEQQLQNHGESLVNEAERRHQKNLCTGADWKEEVEKHVGYLDYETEKAATLVEQSNDIGFLLAVNETLKSLETAEKEAILSEPPRHVVFVPNEVVVENMPIGRVGALEEIPAIKPQDGNMKARLYEWQEARDTYSQYKGVSRSSSRPATNYRGKTLYDDNYNVNNLNNVSRASRRPDTGVSHITSYDRTVGN
ncbi:protein meiotic P26-like [Saccoglossus kowalevskii]